MVLKFVIAAIIGIAILGGGGLALLTDLGKKTKEEFVGSGGSENKSTLDAEQKDKEFPQTEKEKKSDEKAGQILSDFKLTKASSQRIESDIFKLDTRREKSKGKRKFFLKKSGTRVVREKERQERRAFTFLRNQGFKFGGTGKFGRPKLFGNPNFDLGLPSSATQKDRERVIARQARRNAKRRLILLRNKQRLQIQSQFKGKSQAELIKIAESRGLKIHGGLDAKQLAGILQRIGN